MGRPRYWRRQVREAVQSPPGDGKVVGGRRDMGCMWRSDRGRRCWGWGGSAWREAKECGWHRCGEAGGMAADAGEPGWII